MAPDGPVTWCKLGPARSSDPTISYYPSGNNTTFEVVFVGSSGRESAYEAELRRARAGPDLAKMRKLTATLNLWFALRAEEAERAERFREWPPARPAKTRTEWGMVHRERCVHRCGL